MALSVHGARHQYCWAFGTPTNQPRNPPQQRRLNASTPDSLHMGTGLCSAWPSWQQSYRSASHTRRLPRHLDSSLALSNTRPPWRPNSCPLTPVLCPLYPLPCPLLLSLLLSPRLHPLPFAFPPLDNSKVALWDRSSAGLVAQRGSSEGQQRSSSPSAQQLSSATSAAAHQRSSSAAQ